MNRNLLVGVLIALVVGGLTYWVAKPAAQLPPPQKPSPSGETAGKPPAPQPPVAPVARARADVAPIPILSGPDARGTLRLQGQVLGSDEQPVDGANVTIDLNPPTSVRTERDGTFVFTGLAPRAYRVEARHGRAASPSAQVRLTEKTEPLILRLRPASALEVSVIGAATRQGIANARVEVRGADVLTATTGPDGKALLEGLLAGRYVVKASAEGFAETVEPVNVGDAALENLSVTVELQPGLAVSGEVVDGKGRPVSGIPVLAESVAAVVAVKDPSRDGVRTDANGRWRIPALPAGTYRFVAEDASHAPGVSSPVQVKGEREISGVVITLPDTLRVSGRVVDGSEAPVPFATVRAVVNEGGLGQSLARQTQSNQAGEFVLEGLPRKRVDLVALHESATSSTQKLDLTDGAERSGLILALDADRIIRGTVVSAATGAPVPDAVILAEPTSAAARSRSELTLRGKLSAVADVSGRFELRGLRPGTYTLKAAPPGTSIERRTSWLRQGVRAEAGGPDVTLQLTADGKVKGRVLQQDGGAPALFMVSVGGVAGGAAGKNAQGEFLIENVPPGTHVVMVTGPSFVTKVVQAVKVKPDEETDVGTINVDSGRRISGRVVLPNGEPVIGATVTVSKRMGGNAVVAGPAAAAMSDIRTAVTRTDGSFLLEGIGITPLNLAAEHPQYGRSTFHPVEAGVDEVRMNLVLNPTGILTGRVTQRGQPLAGVLVLASVKDAPGGGSGVTTGTDGTYQFETLTPGTYSVAAILDTGAGQQMKNATVAVRATEAAQLDFDLPRGDITLMVEPKPDAQGRPLSARVFLEEFKGAPPAAGQPPPPGAVQSQMMSTTEPAKFPNLSPGSYRLCVVPPWVQADAGPSRAPACSIIAVAEMPPVQQLAVAVPTP